MGWRILTVDSAGKLSLKNNQLLFKTSTEEKSVAIEDLECVLLENQQIEITHPLLSRLAEEGVMLVSTDSKHQASGITVSYWGQYKKIEILEHQLSITKPLKKQLWRKFVSQKISNQALCLEKLNIPGAEKLHQNSKVPNEISNLEGISSAYYFKNLFQDIDEKFVRQQYYDKDITLLNAGLNYCYALVRAIIIRYVTASGLLPYLGVHHCSKVNAFNLADDMIEPYRPIVDYHVRQYLDYLCYSDDEVLSLDIRRELQKIFLYKIKIDDKNIKLPTACQMMCLSYIEALQTRNAKNLKLPLEWCN